ncbi:MAG: hypothetical protein CMJ84_01155 [Planctomycetes bacterium]|nr:hypothetical protein [Planctomycetota bacterium]MDP6408317.1 VCBS repeat-containing protein [Planctomycetota bacterium]
MTRSLTSIPFALLLAAPVALPQSFGPQQIITTAGDHPLWVSTADFDGDGDQDVLSVSYQDHTVAWHENTDGAGTFGPQQIISTAAQGDHLFRITTADLDGDGDADVLSSSAQDDKVA